MSICNLFTTASTEDANLSSVHIGASCDRTRILTSMSGKSLLYGDPIDEDTIRVLEVKSSKTFNSQVQCNLVAYPRSRCRPYEALSYCWGTEDLGFECVLVDGQEIQAGKPLATALHYLRLTDETRYMWVDAICINQGSNEEKSNQVKRMDATYEHAAFVLVWLGEPSESTKTHLAMKAIGRLGSQYKDQALQDVHDQQLLLPEVEGCGPSVYLPAIRQILQRDWFRRLWVSGSFACTAKLIKYRRSFKKSVWRLKTL